MCNTGEQRHQPLFFCFFFKAALVTSKQQWSVGCAPWWLADYTHVPRNAVAQWRQVLHTGLANGRLQLFMWLCVRTHTHMRHTMINIVILMLQLSQIWRARSQKTVSEPNRCLTLPLNSCYDSDSPVGNIDHICSIVSASVCAYVQLSHLFNPLQRRQVSASAFPFLHDLGSLKRGACYCVGYFFK